MNSTAPAAPNTVNWFSTLTPIADVGTQAGAKSTGIAAPHAAPSRRSPCHARANPCAAPSDAPLTSPIRGERAEVGVVTDERGAGGKSGGVAGGARADPGCCTSERPLAAHHWTAASPAPVSAPPTSAVAIVSTGPLIFHPMYPAIGKARATAAHRRPGKGRRRGGA